MRLNQFVKLSPPFFSSFKRTVVPSFARVLSWIPNTRNARSLSARIAAFASDETHRAISSGSSLFSLNSSQAFSPRSVRSRANKALGSFVAIDASGIFLSPLYQEPAAQVLADAISNLEVD